MAITTYSTLQTAADNWLAGQVATARIQECIALAEAEMSRVLYDNSEENRATTSTIADTARYAMPLDCRRARTLRIADTTGGTIEYIAPTIFDRLTISGGGRPRYYTVEAGVLRLAPTPDAVYTLETIYQKGITALSDSATSNDILTRHPDAYLHGTLMNAFDFLMDEERAAKSRARFNELLIEIAGEAERARFGATPLVRKSPYREIVR